jgi:hypothetical protein
MGGGEGCLMQKCVWGPWPALVELGCDLMAVDVRGKVGLTVMAGQYLKRGPSLRYLASGFFFTNQTCMGW